MFYMLLTVCTIMAYIKGVNREQCLVPLENGKFEGNCTLFNIVESVQNILS